MAFTLGTTAGAGTVSVAAGGIAVTGVGTAFVAGNVGAILIVGSQWGFISAVASGTSATLDRPFTTAVSGAAYSLSGNYPIITQSGTDTSLAALATTPGVENLNIGDGRTYQPLNTQLNITGNLTFNGFLEKLFYNNQTDTSVGGVQRDGDIRVSGTLTVNLSQVVNGQTIYAPDTVYFSRRPPPSGGGASHQLNTSGSSFATLNNGTTNLTGGTYLLRHVFACQGGGRLNVIGSYIRGNGSRFWMERTSITSFLNCTIENFQVWFNTFPTVLSGVTFKNCSAISKEPQSTTDGFEAAPNIILAPKWLATENQIIALWRGTWMRVKNSIGGTSYGIKTSPNTDFQTYGIGDFVQDVAFTTKDLSGAAVTGFKFYATESDDGNRRSLRAYTNTGATYDNTDIRAMLWTTAAGGGSNTIEMRLGAGFTTTRISNVHQYLFAQFSQTANDEYDFYGIGYNYGLYQNRIQCRADGALIIPTVALPDLLITEPTMATVAAYTSLNTAQQLYDFAKFYLYDNFTGQTATYVGRAGNVIDAGSYNITIDAAAADPFTIGGSSFTIKSAAFAGGLTTTGTITLAAGSVLTNSTVTAPNILQAVPTDLTGVTTTGNLTYNTNTPITITLTDCQIQGTISNTGSGLVTITRVNSTIGTVGANVVAQQLATVSAPNLLAGSRVRLFNSTDNVEMFNGVLASAGFSETFAYTGNKNITLTATYANGVTAKLGLSASSIFTATGATFLDSQVDDAVYNGYGIDGSTVTGFAADYIEDDVNLTVGGNFTASNLYAWWVHNLTTESGIREFFGGITALDAANLRINVGTVNIYLDNITASFVYQSDTIRLFRSDGIYPARTVTTGGGGIQVNWNANVYVGTANIDDAVLTLRADAAVINEGVKKASLMIPHTTNLA